MKISLKTPMFLNGHRYSPGDVVDLPAGVEGPYAAGVPAYDVIDEESWNERAELTAKHAKEREELETPERKREELLRRQADESADLRRKHADKELTRKHEREKANLESQHKAQAEALKNREPEKVAPPRETNEAELSERHKVEAEDLVRRQEAERKALADEHKGAEERQKAVDEQPTPVASAPVEPEDWPVTDPAPRNTPLPPAQGYEPRAPSATSVPSQEEVRRRAREQAASRNQPATEFQD